MGLIANLFFSDLVEMLPTIHGDFSHVIPPRTFEEKILRRSFWSFNEKNKDLYFSFGSSKHLKDGYFHILDGKPIDSQLNIYWNVSQGTFTILNVEGPDMSYSVPVGWHQGIFLMRNDYLGGYEVLITKEREAECRENHNIVYEAIEIIRKKHDLIRSGQILSSEKKKRFWLPYIIINLILLALIGLSFFLINITFKYDILCILTILFSPIGILITLIIALCKYKVFKAKARADFFDEI